MGIIWGRLVFQIVWAGVSTAHCDTRRNCFDWISQARGEIVAVGIRVEAGGAVEPGAGVICSNSIWGNGEGSGTLPEVQECGSILVRKRSCDQWKPDWLLRSDVTAYRIATEEFHFTLGHNGPARPKYQKALLYSDPV